MRASISFGFDDSRVNSTDLEFSPWSGEGGNPRLQPWIADAVDLSLEKYFGREGYVSGALYYKDLKTYIYTQSALYDFTGFPVTGGIEPALRQGFVTTPQNGEGGEIYGYEVAATVPFGMALAALEGFGIQASYSLTKSNVQPDPLNPARPIPGLSEDVINATLYYERAGFSTRVSARHRSSFIAEVQGVGAERLLRMAKGETLIDAQMSYEFQSGTARRFDLAAARDQPHRRAVHHARVERFAASDRSPGLRPPVLVRSELQVLMPKWGTASATTPCRCGSVVVTRSVHD